MSKLIDLFLNIQSSPRLEQNEAEHRFIEALTFSTSPEIVRFLDEMYARDFTALPVWLRNLAFRIACLQEPNNPCLLRKAAADLECFGPDWDDMVTELRNRAKVIETGG